MFEIYNPQYFPCTMLCNALTVTYFCDLEMSVEETLNGGQYENVLELLDEVEKQVENHRRKALALLGESHQVIRI